MNMLEATAQWGQLATILMMAVALGMDAFSLGIGVGMRGIRLLDVLRISFLIGLFHILMPLLGICTGQYLGHLLGQVAQYVSGGLLLILGIHMIVNSFRGSAVQSLNHRTMAGMLIFALSVSVDSFSVGVSLGLFRSDIWLTVIAFGLFGALMSVIGLMLGRRVSHSLGEYGEAIGGSILLAFGLLFIF